MHSRLQLEFLGVLNRDWKLGSRTGDGIVVKVELVTPLVEKNNMIKVGFFGMREDIYFQYLNVENKWVEI